MPWVLAAAAAQQLQRVMQHAWLRGFGLGAAPAVVGLLAVTTLDLARHAVTSWAYAVLAVVALVLTLRTQVHPTLILLGGATAGAGLGALMGARIP
jgi:chromate transport protein ChrA